jgi:hypothetical protein
MAGNGLAVDQGVFRMRAPTLEAERLVKIDRRVLGDAYRTVQPREAQGATTWVSIVQAKAQASFCGGGETSCADPPITPSSRPIKRVRSGTSVTPRQ